MCISHNRLTFFFLVLEEKLEKLRVENKVGSLTELIKDLHIYPDFHGNAMFSFFDCNEKVERQTFGFFFSQETGLQSQILGCKGPLLVFHS